MSLYTGPTAPTNEDDMDDLLRKIALSLDSSSSIPTWNSRTFAYVGSTNNVSTIVYKLNGTTVATQTFTYVAAGAADNDDIATETIAY